MTKYSEATSLIGETLLILQKVEAVIKASLILSFGASADIKFQRLLKEDKQTFGMLLRVMRSIIELPTDFDEDLRQLLHLRNTFVHKLFIEDWFNLRNQQGLNELDIFLKNILNKSGKAIRIFIAFATIKTNEDLGENILLFNKIIERIILTATPLESKAMEAYIEKFSKDVTQNYRPKITKK